MQDITENLPFEKPEEKENVKKVVDLLEAPRAEEVNEIYESFLFFRRDQAEHETIVEYVSAIRAIASTCICSDLKERLIRDRVVCGIRNINKALHRTFLEDSKPTLKKGIDRCKVAQLDGQMCKARQL